MNAKSTIRKIMFITLWVCIGGGMLTLLLAAISKKNKGECKDYSISIKGAANNFFIDKNDVEQMLKKETKSDIKGLPVASFNLHQLEQLLEKNTWVSKAEIYFDNRDVLHVTVTEKEPVARIFTTGTSTFYIDSAGKKMPLSDKLSARVPVFTGFPDKRLLTARDSELLNDVRVTANYILNDPFWMAQVAQIDITPERTFEMIPVVGNHTVRLGNGDKIEKKFHRLMVFYKQVLSKTGFDKYKVIDVVASRSGMEKTDTALLRKNIEKLLKQSRDAQDDTVTRSVPVAVGQYKIDVDSATAVVAPAKPVDDKPKPVKQDRAKPNDDKQPKAVMPKRNSE
jgi:cell division protein FtsQ